MPQPNQGKPAPSAPTAAPIWKKDGGSPSNNGVQFGGPGGSGTKGSGTGAK